MAEPIRVFLSYASEDRDQSRRFMIAYGTLGASLGWISATSTR